MTRTPASSSTALLVLCLAACGGDIIARLPVTIELSPVSLELMRP